MGAMPNRSRRFSSRLWRWVVDRVWRRPAGWIFEPDPSTPVRLRFLANISVVLLLALVGAVGFGLLLWWALGWPRLAPESPAPLTPTDLYGGLKMLWRLLVALVVWSLWWWPTASSGSPSGNTFAPR